jgi:hypothetical protein
MKENTKKNTNININTNTNAKSEGSSFSSEIFEDGKKKNKINIIYEKFRYFINKKDKLSFVYFHFFSNI